MKVRTLLSAVQDAQASGDITAESPVFAVVRHETLPLDSLEAWYAVSIVQIELNADEGFVVCIADSSDDAADMTVAVLLSRLRKLPSQCLQQDVHVALRGDLTIQEGAGDSLEVVDAYADEHGLGLMVWFDGYAKWRESNT